MLQGIYEVSRHTYKVGSTKDIMYYSAGTSIDWSYGVAKIPFSYMLELRGKEHRFLLPSECILTTATEVLNGVLNLLRFVCSNACMNHDSCSCPTWKKLAYHKINRSTICLTIIIFQ